MKSFGASLRWRQKDIGNHHNIKLHAYLGRPQLKHKAIFCFEYLFFMIVWLAVAAHAAQAVETASCSLWL